MTWILSSRLLRYLLYPQICAEMLRRMGQKPMAVMLKSRYNGICSQIYNLGCHWYRQSPQSSRLHIICRRNIINRFTMPNRTNTPNIICTKLRVPVLITTRHKLCLSHRPAVWRLCRSIIHTRHPVRNFWIIRQEMRSYTRSKCSADSRNISLCRNLRNQQSRIRIHISIIYRAWRSLSSTAQTSHIPVKFSRVQSAWAAKYSLAAGL